MTRCPTCNCPEPHLHPAMQSGGEVEVCADGYHLTPTPQNLPAYIELVAAKRRRRLASDGPCKSEGGAS